MKTVLTERNLVLVLFVMVFIIFSFAHEDSKKMEKGYLRLNTYTAKNLALPQPSLESSPSLNTKVEKASYKEE